MRDGFAPIKHPLSRDGLSQEDRINERLDTDSAPIDGRTLSELLQYLYEYARQVNYYKEDDEFRSGDWVPFFRNSTPFQYALIGGFGLENLEERFNKIERSIEQRRSFTSLNLLFDLIFEISQQLEQWHDALSEDKTGLRAAIESLIDTNLSKQMQKLVGLANSAGQWGYQYPKNVQVLTKTWGLSIPQVYGVDASITSLMGSTRYKVLEAKKILAEIYRTFWKGLQAIVALAQDESQLEKSLQDNDEQNHPPHLGLLFAFLLLFKELQGNLNDLSEAHLDFFYRKTLKLKEQPHLADSAHLVFELAKKVEEDVLLEKGTRLKAGKDKSGADIFFELEEELVLTKAKVASLRTLFVEQGKSASFLPDGLLSLHTAPVANSADGQGEQFPKELPPSWNTVGSRKSKWTDPESGTIVNHPFARLGFIVASKVLWLREGKRKVSVNISVAEDCLPPDTLSAYFDVYLSTEEGWTILPNQVDGEQAPVEAAIDSNGFTLEFTLQPGFLPVMNPGAEAFGVDYGYREPMLKLEFNQEHPLNNTDNGTYQSPYYWLRIMQVSAITIDAWVCDVRNLIVQNDQALVDINKPFQPFGPAPKEDSSYFWIGNEEIFCKNWQAIDINMLWKDLPDFDEYYEGYPSSPPDENGYEASIELLFEQTWIQGSGGNLKLFLNDDDSRISQEGAACCPGDTVYGHIESTEFANAQPCPVPSSIVNGYTTDLECGFLRLKLKGDDFRHDEYQDALTKAVFELAEAATVNQNGLVIGGDNDKVLLLNLNEYYALKNNLISAESNAQDTKSKIENLFNGPLIFLQQRYDQATSSAGNTESSIGDAREDFQSLFTEQDITLPNEPYTPLLESLSLDYHATASTNDNHVAFTHLHPWQGAYEHFGSELTPTHSTNEPTILPCFIDEGSLYIGLEQYTPGSKVHLYFQMTPYTADPQTDKAVVCWEYLRHNQWKELRPDIEVLSDSTKGFIQSGIVELAVPSDISSQHATILPSAYHWLKARVLLRTSAIAETLAVRTQAAKAVFTPAPENDLSRLESPLEAELITKLASPKASVKGVSQLFPGFGGRPKEDTPTFNRRISEHLRHKGRAISLYDYEHLVLQAFPEVFKVKCITHTLGRRGEEDDYELCPGFVTLVVVPDLEKGMAEDIYQPRVPASTLQAIKDFLKPKMSPFIHLEVLNPKYEAVEVSAKVKFQPGKSADFYTRQLQKEVREFLAPWVSAQHRADISFGGKIYYSLILEFIESRPYVDYALELSVAKEEEGPSDVVNAEGARGVLTTSKEHNIQQPTEADLMQSGSFPAGSGIGFDIIPE